MALRVSGVGVGGQLRSVQVLPAWGEHGDQRLLPGRGVHDAAVPGSLSVDEGSPAVPQPGGVGEAQVSVNYPQCTTAQDRAITWGGFRFANVNRTFLKYTYTHTHTRVHIYCLYIRLCVFKYTVCVHVWSIISLLWWCSCFQKLFISLTNGAKSSLPMPNVFFSHKHP